MMMRIMIRKTKRTILGFHPLNLLISLRQVFFAPISQLVLQLRYFFGGFSFFGFMNDKMVGDGRLNNSWLFYDDILFRASPFFGFLNWNLVISGRLNNS